MRFEGVLKRWDDDRGFGFIEPMQGGQELFVHIKAFPPGTGRPVPNMQVSFELEHNADGKKRARNVLFSRPARGTAKTGNRSSKGIGRVNLTVLLGFTALLILASILWQPAKFFAIAYGVLSLITFFVYWNDKSAAKSGDWRTSEELLHMLSLLGGWPGAIIAQQVFRHKTTKREFRILFWTTVFLNIAVFILLATPLLRLILSGHL